MNIFNRN